MLNSTHNEDDQFDEDILRIFVWSVWNYFGRVTNTDPEVGVPYLFEEFPHNEYTGILAVAGSQKGSIFLSVSKEFLDELLVDYHNNALPDQSNESAMEELRIDCAGEMLNIVAGNARNYLGEDFLISVPVVTQQQGMAVVIPRTALGIIFPVEWGDHRIHLVLAFQENQNWSHHETLERPAV